MDLKSKIHRLMAVLVTFMVALGLVACGGGGGGGSTAPVTNPTPTPTLDTTPPQLTLSTSSPMSLTGTIVINSNEPLSGNYSLTVTTGSTTVVGNTTLGAGATSLSWAPSGFVTLPANSTLKVTGSASDLAGNTQKIDFTLTTASAGVWPPSKIYPIGEKVTGFGTLPGTSVAIGDAPWREAVANGTIKFVDTGAVMTGFTDRPIVWAVYLTGPVFCAKPVYKSDGGAIGSLTDTVGGCKTNIADFVVGSSDGIIRRSTPSNQCFKLRWNSTNSTFDDLAVACP